MKNAIIGIMLMIFLVLFIRLSIFDSGFFLGVKKTIAFEVPVQTVAYRSGEESLLRGLETGIVLLQVVSEFDYIIVGKSKDEWLFFDKVTKDEQKD